MTFFQYLLLRCLCKVITPLSGIVARKTMNIYFAILKAESRLMKLRAQAMKRLETQGQ